VGDEESRNNFYYIMKTLTPIVKNLLTKHVQGAHFRVPHAKNHWRAFFLSLKQAFLEEEIAHITNFMKAKRLTDAPILNAKFSSHVFWKNNVISQHALRDSSALREIFVVVDSKKGRQWNRSARRMVLKLKSKLGKEEFEKFLYLVNTANTNWYLHMSQTSKKHSRISDS
jgi:hypothetical protein